MSDIPTTANLTNSIAAATNTTGYYSNNGGTATWSSPTGVTAALSGGIISALPYQLKADYSSITNLSLGTYLENHGKVNGNVASIINGVMGLVKTSASATKDSTIPSFTHDIKFIPVILKTEFNLASSSSSDSRSSWYLVFDSTPESIVFNKAANWAPKDFPGRPEPIQVYANSSAQTFSLEGWFFAETASILKDKINLANRLTALVTPSKARFMPSPVEVRIGDWKRLRCIINSITITYEGPWWVGTTSTSTTNTTSTSSTTSDLKTHTPYTYKVLFNFTVTSEQNYLQYAEDIMDNGDTYGYMSGTISKEEQSQLAAAIISQAQTGIFTSAGESTQVSSVSYSTLGTVDVVNNVSNTGTSIASGTTSYLSKLGLPTDVNGSLTNTGYNAMITSGLTAEVQQKITNIFGSTINKI